MKRITLLLLTLLLTASAVGTHSNTASAITTGVLAEPILSQEPVSIVQETVILEADDPTTHFRHSNDENNYLDITLDDTRLKIEGKTIHTERTYLWFQIRRPGSESKVKDEIFTMNSDGSYTYETNLSLSNGTYEIYIYHCEQRYSTYWSLYNGIRFEKTSKDGYRFVLSPYYQEAIEFLQNLDPISPKDTNYSWYDQHEQDAFQEVLKAIIKPGMTDYEKMMAISTWVSNTVHYDYDCLYGRSNPNPSTSNVSGSYAFMTLYARRSVCQGYAELSNVLFRMAGIPSRVVSGATVYNRDKDTFWDKPVTDPSQAVSSHSWNVVFVDGRWRYIDTTWNTSNKYEHGKYIEGDTVFRYFDQTLASFSRTHRSLRVSTH
ncbi:transglutaminase domain-containing protein [Anoxynatronum buryatiense]|uniref:Transglutaminase-like superfamily protein n=1 Tax=Anoxynatronum buryatiense TaxID=489973 RepID=A0AA45WYX9_9CLOT|nr:transglutaminase-like domain-containing protein [Anoxynatronum buryatiense]SMP69309.1 Transglutaminase-like superfamily protein [Anoxynatronum buryatiense]